MRLSKLIGFILILSIVIILSSYTTTQSTESESSDCVYCFYEGKEYSLFSKVCHDDGIVYSCKKSDDQLMWSTTAFKCN